MSAALSSSLPCSTAADSALGVYRIPRFQGQADTTFTAEASLSSVTVRKAWSRPPISIDFQVLMFTASGLLVRFLKVFEKGNYQSVKVSLTGEETELGCC